VYLLNDRSGIYALGYPIISALGHLVNLAELTVLATGAYVLLLGVNAIFGWLARRGTTAPALLREIRASFYRKLFLAFVLAVIIPVVALALLTRYYVAAQMRANVEQEAIRTASAARRVVEDLVAPRATEQGVGVDDNLMVWVSRLIDQDVNLFTGSRLVATSERNLFASGLLPTRTPADVYHALELRNEAATVTREHIDTLEYLVAASHLRVRQLEATLTVPLTARQQEIDDQIDTLDRRVLVGALLFILAGAGLGYSMAERISDPVNRLTRATRRITRGDLDARIAATSSDELRRLVEDFNSMAAELQRQRKELERTHRLEAWAEMARQVAHEIKNPLTPIQLNAEHLRRVHHDRGEPLSPILQTCVENILTQVKLLRQIASEFSSFASSPTARRSRVDVPDLLREILDPYRTGPRRADSSRGQRARGAAVGLRRSDTHCAIVDEHRRERDTRHARTWHVERRGRHRRSRRAHSRVGYGRRDGCRSARARIRTVLLDQGDRDRPGAADCQAQRRTEWRNDLGRERTGQRNHRGTVAPDGGRSGHYKPFVIFVSGVETVSVCSGTTGRRLIRDHAQAIRPDTRYVYASTTRKISGCAVNKTSTSAMRMSTA
jgi:HAMP domain-containing protein